MWPRPRRCSSTSSASDDHPQRLQLSASGGRGRLVSEFLYRYRRLGRNSQRRPWAGAQPPRSSTRSRCTVPRSSRDCMASSAQDRRKMIAGPWAASPSSPIRRRVQRQFSCLRYPALFIRPQRSLCVDLRKEALLGAPGARAARLAVRCVWVPLRRGAAYRHAACCPGRSEPNSEDEDPCLRCYSCDARSGVRLEW